MAEAQSAPPRRINCRVLAVADGSKQLIFEVAGTDECVGEVRVAVADPGYLPVVAELFRRWATGAPGVQPHEVHRAIKRAINGHH